MDERFTADARKLTAAGQKIETHYVNNLYKMGELLQSLCGFLVIVPSNPEGSYFQMVEGILNFLKKDEWGQSPDAYIVQVRVLDSVVRYLASQTQDTLPYRIANVESNDQIFIGDENFQNDCNQLMDHCFEQILDIIQKLDAVKDQYYPVLFESCLDAANILIGSCNIQQKTGGFINKMFKMSDKYLSENNNSPTKKITLARYRINLSYEAFRKKKENTRQAPP